MPILSMLRHESNLFLISLERFEKEMTELQKSAFLAARSTFRLDLRLDHTAVLSKSLRLALFTKNT